MIVIRANTPDQVLEQTILSLLQQAQIEAEQITFCAKKKLELPGLVIDNTRHEISANGRNISLTRLESDLLWVLAVCEGTTLSKKELFDAVWGKDCADTLKVVGNTVSNLRKKLAFCGLDGCLCTVGGGYAFRYVLAEQVPVVGCELVAADVLEPVFAGWGQIREAGDCVVVREGKPGDPLGFHKCSQLLYGHGAVRLHGMIMQFDPFPHGRDLL